MTMNELPETLTRRYASETARLKAPQAGALCGRIVRVPEGLIQGDKWYRIGIVLAVKADKALVVRETQVTVHDVSSLETLS